MYSHLLQDWTTIRLDSTQTSLVQSESGWIDCAGVSDIVFWLECPSVEFGGGDLILLSYETAPAKDEALFNFMADAVSLSPSATPVVTPVLLSAGAGRKLARWVRWRLWQANTMPNAAWSATFRVHCALNAVGQLPSGLRT